MRRESLARALTGLLDRLRLAFGSKRAPNSEERQHIIKVNVNLPNPHFRIRADPDWTWYRNAGRRGVRVVRIDPGNLAQMLPRIGVGPYRFLAQKGFNAMWLEFDFPDEGSAMAAIRQVKGVLDRRHKPIRRVEIETHCRTNRW